MNTQRTMIPPAKPIIGQDERDAVDRVLASGMVAQGPEVAAFEQEFGRHWRAAGNAWPSTRGPRGSIWGCWRWGCPQATR